MIAYRREIGFSLHPIGMHHIDGAGWVFVWINSSHLSRGRGKGPRPSVRDWILDLVC